MAQKVNFPFKKKEGKFFAPIVGKTNKKTLVNGVVTTTPIPKSGVKGVYARVRLELPTNQASTKKELYAISSEAFISSR